jgi:hypothetical protein
MIITIYESSIRKIHYCTFFFLNIFSFFNFHNIFFTYFKITNFESNLYILSKVTFSYFFFYVLCQSLLTPLFAIFLLIIIFE